MEGHQLNVSGLLALGIGARPSDLDPEALSLRDELICTSRTQQRNQSWARTGVEAFRGQMPEVRSL